MKINKDLYLSIPRQFISSFIQHGGDDFAMWLLACVQSFLAGEGKGRGTHVPSLVVAHLTLH